MAYTYNDNQPHGTLLTKGGTKSLAEVNGSIAVPKTNSFWRRLLAFFGPGALIAVGYMDPGNWVTSVQGGASYHYLLMSVVLISAVIGMLLQYLAGKLGIVTQQDLAQATAQRTNRVTRYFLWFITELALIATDIAEVVGGAIALNLLFGWPLILTVMMTAFDVILLLGLMKFGFRKIEALVMTLILTILFVCLYLVILSKPDLAGVFAGSIPQPEILSPQAYHGLASPLFLTAGIIGATVTPHNLYLHSSIVQTRQVDHSNRAEVRSAIKCMAWDSNLQLSLAFVVNALLLIVGAALFYGHADELASFKAMYLALQNNNLAGAIASPFLSTIFAVALLASGQNSTITGTLAGEIIMEGFLHFKMPMWVRRILTRGLALVPVILITMAYGGQEHQLDQLITGTQVFLSVVLPFSMAPLIYFTSSKKIMGPFVNRKGITIVAWICFVILSILNLWLVWQQCTQGF
nr:Nramp family divalent metal transporter [Fructobacillus ficulneus]